MKTFLILFIFITTLFASDLASTYKATNREIDKLAPQLTLQERVQLYSLVMSTYTKKITNEPYDAIKKQTLNTIANLHNGRLPFQEVETLHKLYTTLITTKVKKTKESNEYMTPIIIALSTLFLGAIIFLVGKKIYCQRVMQTNREGETKLTTLLERQKSTLSEKNSELQREVMHLQEYVESLKKELSKYENAL